MENIQSYQLFENLQQAEKFVLENQVRYYEPLKEFLKSKGKLGWLYLFTVILYEAGNNKNSEINYNKVIELLEKIIKHNVKIDADELLKNYKIYKGLINSYLWGKVVISYNKSMTNNFIDKFAPGFLKNDIKNGKDKRGDSLFYKLYDVLFVPTYGGNIDVINNIDTDLLKGKMSMFKNPEEWIEYVKIANKGNSIDNIEKIKNSDKVIIHYENDDWIIYQPTTYESMNLIIYPHWCTIVKSQWNRIIRSGFLIILYNRKDIKESYVAEFNGSDFGIHDYFDRHIDHKMNSGFPELDLQYIYHDTRRQSKIWKDDEYVSKYISNMKPFENMLSKYGGKNRELNNSEKEIFNIFLHMLDKFRKIKG